MNIYTDYDQVYSISEPIQNKTNKLFEIRKFKVQKKWSPEEDIVLLELAKKFNSKSWKKISRHFNDKTPLQCFSRYKRIRPGIIKGSWTREEDVRIIEMVKIYGKAWSKISKSLVTRNGKQIRDRFINILDPSIKKGKFTLEEDLKLLNLYKHFGTKWATISTFFDNRTADMIKNRYHSSIKKNIKFLEDLQIDYPNLNKDSSADSFNEMKTNLYEDSTNLNSNLCSEQIEISQSSTLEEDIKLRNNVFKKEYEHLQVDNIINLSFFQNSFYQSPIWKLEDYFVL